MSFASVRQDSPLLLRVEFDDETLVDRRRQFATLWVRLVDTLGSLRVDLDPLWKATSFGGRERRFDAKMSLGLLADFNDVAGTDLLGRDIHAATVDQHAIVTDDLTRLRT